MPYVIIFFLVIALWQYIVDAFYCAVIVLFVFVLYKLIMYLLQVDNTSKSPPVRLNLTAQKNQRLEAPASNLSISKAPLVTLDSAALIIKDLERNGALIIDKPWIDLILSGQKTWEMRATKFKKSGYISLIAKGSKTVVGIAKIQGFEGPLSIEQLQNTIDKHHVPKEQFMAPKYTWFVAMKLTNIYHLSKPISYQHKSGSVIWVKLSEQPEVINQIASALESIKRTQVKPKATRKSSSKNTNIMSANGTKAAMQSLLANKDVLPDTKSRIPLSTTNKTLSDDYCIKDGLYHMKLDSKEYRFESKSALLNALRKLESAQWALFDSRGRRSWQTTKSWIKVRNKM
jgi:hypothetical protein